MIMKNSKIISENYQDYVDASERRNNREWELGPDCPEEGIKAHALLSYLEDEGLDFFTPELRLELQKLQNTKEQLEKVKEDMTDESDIEDIEDRIESLNDDIEEYENYKDVYDIIPVGEHYDMTTFKVLDGDNITYAVGNEKEVDDSAKEAVEQLIDDIGYQGFNKSFVQYYLDDDEIEEAARDDYEYDVNNNPDSWLDDSERQLSDEQDEQIAIIKNKILRIDNLIDKLNDVDDEYDKGEVERKIYFLEEQKTELEDEIEDIQDNPEGDFRDDAIEEKVDNLVRNAMEDPMGYLNETGRDWEDFIDKKQFIRGVIDEDGFAHLLNRYDGNYDEVNVMGNLYFVMRID
jgi:hypothetical protein